MCVPPIHEDAVDNFLAFRETCHRDGISFHGLNIDEVCRNPASAADRFHADLPDLLGSEFPLVEECFGCQLVGFQSDLINTEEGHHHEEQTNQAYTDSCKPVTIKIDKQWTCNT